MGEVWLAQDERLDEAVALKFLPPAIRGDPVALDDLRSETARSRKLTYPNIVRIHDLHEEDGDMAFIAMEYVDGPTLALTRLQQPSRVFSWEMLRPLMEQLCAALDYAHGEHVIHRDLKPANIMVDRKGRLKLADFGIAATVSDSMSRISLRHATSGTLVYMSPQQLAGKRPQPGDDIYALGATLYELLTSKPPFYSGDLPHQILNELPEPLSERMEGLGIQNEIPADVSALIMACLAKEPAQRPQSARAVAQWIGLDTVRKPSVDTLGQAMFPNSNTGALEAATGGPHPNQGPDGREGGKLKAISLGLSIAVLCAVAVAVMVWRKHHAGSAAPAPGVALRSEQDAPKSATAADGANINRSEGAEPLVSDLSIAAALASRQAAGAGAVGRFLGAPPNGGRPWTNSLGMRFVPVPGTRVLFSVWDTRVRDYQAFITATRRSWLKPNIPQGPAHPAVNVSWEDAVAFCNWLTRKERKEGVLKPNESYRLPTDMEWSSAVGLEGETGSTPAERSRDVKGLFPWGRGWPPPARAGNYADQTAKQKRPRINIIEGYNDGYAETSPVGSFAPNRHGLYDMGGNVWQWCQDWYDNSQTSRVLRGGAWLVSNRAGLLSSCRFFSPPASGTISIGFRCVLAPVEEQ